MLKNAKEEYKLNNKGQTVRQKLAGARKAMYFSIIAGLVAIVGIGGVFYGVSSYLNAEQSEASFDNPEEIVITAVNTSDNDELIGLNSRAGTCSPDIVGVVEFGETGTLIEPEGKIDSCIGQTFTWYHIKWESGIEGWSISEFLEFSNTEDSAVTEE